jgi:hypothetical protein
MWITARKNASPWANQRQSGLGGEGDSGTMPILLLQLRRQRAGAHSRATGRLRVQYWPMPVVLADNEGFSPREP